MTRSSVEIAAVFVMFALSVSLFIVWFTAFLHGGRVTVAINIFGEMWMEYVLWMIVTAIVTVGFADYLQGEQKKS